MAPQEPITTDHEILSKHITTRNLKNYIIVQYNSQAIAIPKVSSDCANSSLQFLTLRVREGMVYKKIENLKQFSLADASPPSCDGWAAGGQCCSCDGKKCCGGHCSAAPNKCTAQPERCAPNSPTIIACTSSSSSPTPAPVPTPPTPKPTPAPPTTLADFQKGKWTIKPNGINLFPTQRNPPERAIWMYSCTKAQGTACQIGGTVKLTPKMITDNSINYLSLITNLSVVKPSNLVILPNDQPVGGSGIVVPSNGEQYNSGSANGRSTCGQDQTTIAWTKAEMKYLHDKGVTICICLGSWCSNFPVTPTEAEAWGVGPFGPKMNTFMTQFKAIRAYYGNCIDGIDFDWEGYCSKTSMGKGADNFCGWNKQCTGTGTIDTPELRTPAGQEDLSGFGYGDVKTLPAECWIMATASTVKVMNIIAQRMSYEGFIVTAVPISTQLFGPKKSKDSPNKQNQYVDLNPEYYTALMLQWYSGFDAGVSYDAELSKWTKRTNLGIGNDDTALAALATGCDTNIEPDFLSKPSFNPYQHLLATQGGGFPSSFLLNTLDELKTKYDNNTADARCSSKEAIALARQSGCDEWTTTGCAPDFHAPRRIDAPDWWYSDDEFIHESQIDFLARISSLGWKIDTQIVIGLEFWKIGGGSQWGPIPNSLLIKSLNWMLAQKHLDTWDTRENLQKYIGPNSMYGIDTKPDGFAGLGGWTIAGALPSVTGDDMPYSTVITEYNNDNTNSDPSGTKPTWSGGSNYLTVSGPVISFARNMEQHNQIAAGFNPEYTSFTIGGIAYQPSSEVTDNNNIPLTNWKQSVNPVDSNYPTSIDFVSFSATGTDGCNTMYYSTEHVY